MLKLFYAVLVVAVLQISRAEDPLRLLVIAEKRQQDVLAPLSKSLQKSGKWQDIPVAVDREDSPQDSVAQLCQAVSNGASLLLDLTWGGWEKAREIASSTSVPYIRAEVSLAPFMAATESLIDARNGTDAAFIFGGTDELDQGLYYLIGSSSLRVVVADRLENGAGERLSKMRPSPSFFVILTTGQDMNVLYSQSVNFNLTFAYSRWILTFTDFDASSFNPDTIRPTKSVAAILYPNDGLCCDLQRLPPNCPCAKDTKIHTLMTQAVPALLDDLASTQGAALSEPRKWDCTNPDASAGGDNSSVESVYSTLPKLMDSHPGLLWQQESSLVSPRLRIHARIVDSTQEPSPERTSDLAEWTAQNGFRVLPGRILPPMKRFFRVGTVESVPWAYPVLDDAGNPVYDSEGKPMWSGYCVDFIHRLSELMDFDYELVLPKDGGYGQRDKQTGYWTGAVGELARGDEERSNDGSE